MATDDEFEVSAELIVQPSRLETFREWSYKDRLFDSHDFEDLEAYLRVLVRRANVLVEEVRILGQTVNRWAGIIKLLDPEHLEDIPNRLAALEENLESVRQRWLSWDCHVPEGQGQQGGPTSPSQISSEPMTALSAKVQSLESEVEQLMARMASISLPLANQQAPITPLKWGVTPLWLLLLFAVGLGMVNMWLCLTSRI